MEIRAMVPADLDGVRDIDANIESGQYLHIDRIGEGLNTSWKMQPRPLREKRMHLHRLSDDLSFEYKLIASGADEGTALVAEHDGQIIAAALVRPDPVAKVFRILDVRVDYDFRRQGLAQGILFQIITSAREAGMRAVFAQAPADNFPALEFLIKLGFEPGGLDAFATSNHDLVKESVVLFWCLVLV